MKRVKEILKQFWPLACILTSIDNSSAWNPTTAISLPLLQLAIPSTWKTLFSINKNTVKKQKKQQIETSKTKIIKITT